MMTASSDSLISIIIASFNCELYLRQSLESVLSQSEPRLTVIVVDDGSTDATVRIVKQIANEDERVRLVQIEHTGFPGVVRNRGIEHVRTPFVAFLDADDFYHPERVERAIHVLQANSQLTAVFHDHVRFWENEDVADQEPFLGGTKFVERAGKYLDAVGEGLYVCKPSFYSFMSLEQIPMHTSAVTVRLEAFQVAGGFSEALRYNQDEDLWLRLALQGQFAYLDEPLSYFRLRPDSHTGHFRVGVDTSKSESVLQCNVELYIGNYLRGAAQMSPADQKACRSLVATRCMDLAYYYAVAGATREERRALMKAWAWRRSWTVLAMLAKSLVPTKLRAALRNLRRGVPYAG